MTTPGRLVCWALGACGLLALLVAVALPLPPWPQAVLAAASLLAGLLLLALPGRLAPLLLAALSGVVSLRYLAWRLAFTLDLPGWPAWLLAVGLAAAETYSIAMLLLGILPAAWPLRRAPLPLPPDPELWPALDVFIPTLDEPAAVVRPTVLAALGMDWPRDRLTVWLLDDGDRPALRHFAAAAGCRYLARGDRAGAKAGNLNHALAHSRADFVAVFDCDHVPTRAFLQFTVGWLLARPELAFVQTPQHFRTADPFQRNLAGAAGLVGEQSLFHRLLQDGNDTWNAAMFTGTGAVLRREALEDVGGFAADSVTEDALTSLRLHRRGWHSAFLNLPLAAGLAAERLSHHLRQRRRWARGMLGILRREPPLLGPGLSLAQRLCYLRACAHFLFPLPRLAFLTAPLALLLLRWPVIAATPLAWAAYGAPHLLLALAAQARLHGRWRALLWGTLYETVLALALLPASLGAWLRPRRGRFTVTPKGTAAPPAFGWAATAPNLALAVVLGAGLGLGAARLATIHLAPTAALALNLAWAALGLLTVLAAIAAGREAPLRARIMAVLPVTVLLPDGRLLAGRTDGIGLRGADLVLEDSGAGTTDAAIEVGFRIGDEDVLLPGRVRARHGQALRVAWSADTLAQEAAVVRVVFGRADAWTGRAAAPPRRPWLGPWHLLVGAAGLVRRRAAVAILLGALLAAGAAHAQNTESDFTVRPVAGAPGEPAPPAPPPAAAAAPPSAAPPSAAAAPSRTVVYTLRQLGAARTLSLRGTDPTQGVRFGVRGDEVVTAATLSLSGAVSPGLIPELSRVTVLLNGEYLASIPSDRRTPAFTIDIPIPPALFQESDRLDFQLAGRAVAACEDPLSGLLWATISDTSTLTLTLQAVAPRRDLARLPLPFLDPHDIDATLLPFVLPSGPGDDTLRAAGIAASWFGALAGGRGAAFPVAADLPAHGNAVLLAIGDAVPALPGAPVIAGPTVAVLPNPRDPMGSILLLAGRTGEEAAAAATALALGARVLGGAVATVQAPDAAPRHPDDAPAWLPADHPIRLGDIGDPAALQVSGYVGRIDLPLRIPPDLFRWGGRPLTLDLRWLKPPGPVVDVAASRLDVGLDGRYLASLPLTRRGDAEAEARVGLPLDAISGRDLLNLSFDARPLRPDPCAAIPSDLHMGVDPGSTIDLSNAARIARLPDLRAFATLGFPFTRLADLSRTAIVLPDQPDAGELSAYLGVMGQFGAWTGLAGTGVAVVRPGETGGVAERDLLAIGTLAGMQAADPLLANSPVRLSGDHAQLDLSDPRDAWHRLVGGARPDRDLAATALSAPIPPGTALLVAAESPLHDGRSVVALLGGDSPALTAALARLRDDEAARALGGDLAILSGGQATSYRVGDTYTVGEVPFWLWPAWYLADQPLPAAALVAVAAVLLGLVLFWTVRRAAAGRLPPRAPRDEA